MSATSAPPVASALASSATATLPPANRSPMMPDPTTVARRRAVPSASATRRRAIVNCCDSVTAKATSPARLYSGGRVNKQRVLFLCTHNSARSQMAEGFLRAMAGARVDTQSAGTEKTAVDPLLAVLRHAPWAQDSTVCDDGN